MRSSAFGTRISRRPPGSPDCWGDGWDPDDSGCQYNCKFLHTCKLEFVDRYDVEEEEDSPTAQIVRRYSATRSIPSTRRRVAQATSATTRRSGLLVPTDHPFFPEEEQEDVPIIRKMVHNAMVGGSRAALHEVFSVLDRTISKVPKY